MHLCETSSNAPRLPSFLDMPQNPLVLHTFGGTVPCTCHAKPHPSFKKWSKTVSFLHFHFHMCLAPQRRALFQHVNFQKCSEHGVLFTCWFRNVLGATTACIFSTAQLPKVLRHCFYHFDFQTRFAPQRHALFPHLKFQKCSEPGVFLAFSLRNVLRATTPYTFPTSQLPKVLRHWSAFIILTSKCASGHSDVYFFNISTSKSAPRLRCF